MGTNRALRLRALLVAVGLLSATSASARAQGLPELFEMARESEPTFLGAQANLKGAQARTRQAYGAMLPQLSMSAGTNWVDRKYKTRNSPNEPDLDRYNSNSYQLNFNQPLWRPGNIAGYEQAELVEAPAN